MKKLIALIAVAPVAVSAQTVTPSFTQGSMQSTTTTTMNITETIQQQIFGGAYSSWSGSNVTPSTTIEDAAATWTVVDDSLPHQLELVSRVAGVVEQIDTTRTITSTSTTTSLSVFSQ